jgi:hypothetical protein
VITAGQRKDRHIQSGGQEVLMKRIAAVLLGLAMGLGITHAAERSGGPATAPAAQKSTKSKKQTAAPAKRPVDEDPERTSSFETPKFDFPGGMTGTFGTIEAPKDPHRPGYLGPGSDSGPQLPAGGLILKKDF